MHGFFGFVFGIILLGAALVVGLVVLGVRLLRGPERNPQAEEDTRLIQELYHGMSRLEERVEALETILLENEEKERT